MLQIFTWESSQYGEMCYIAPTLKVGQFKYHVLFFLFKKPPKAMEKGHLKIYISFLEFINRSDPALANCNSQHCYLLVYLSNDEVT